MTFTEERYDNKMEEEISLRELIEIMLKGKKLIAIITIATIILGGIVGFIADPTYDATAVLLTSPISGNTINSASVNGIIDSMGTYPSMTLETYKEQLINPTVLGNTIQNLNLVDSEGEPVEINTLAQKISVSTVDKTNLIRVTVSDKDPAKAAAIANEISTEFIKFISANTRRMGEQATSIIEEQMVVEEKKLQEQSKRLQEYLAGSQNIDQLKQEASSLSGQINSYKSNLHNVEKQISSDVEALKVLTKDKGTATGINLDDIKVNIPVNGGSSNQELQIELSEGGALQDSLLTIKVTEIETRLVQNLAEQNAINGKLTEMEDRLKEVQSIIAEEEYKYSAIERDYNLALNTYKAYQDRHKEAVVAAASDIGETAIIVSSQAIEPLYPSSHGTLFYAAIGGVLGMMIGVFVVFFKAYWTSSDPKNGNA